MHSTADVCRFIEAAHYKQKVSVMIFTICNSLELSCVVLHLLYAHFVICLDEDSDHGCLSQNL